MTINCEWLLSLLERYVLLEINQGKQPKELSYDNIRFLRDQPKGAELELKLKIE